MDIITIPDIGEDEWNRYVRSHKHGSFLQSWEWGALQEKEGRSVERFFAINGDNPVAAAQCIRYRLPFGRTYGYCPYGPLVDWEKQERCAMLCNRIREWVQQQSGAIFTRVQPGVAESEEAIFSRAKAVLRDMGFRPNPGPGAVTMPEASAVVAVTDDKEEILMAMKSKTRYNIRLAERNDVKTTVISAEQALTGSAAEEFFRLLQETAERAGFHIHPKDRYHNLLEVFSDDIVLIEARHNDHLLASGMLLCWGGRAHYLHGGSTRERSELMGTYAMQWEGIQEARRRGCATYDLGAVARRGDRDSDWKGLTRFKMGFGAERRRILPPYDAVHSGLWYWAYKTARR